MLQSVPSFVYYFESIRRRTLAYANAIPADKAGWTPQVGEYTCSDIVRHLAAAEVMFVGAVVEGKWRYAGHAAGSEASLAAAIVQLEETHLAAMKQLHDLSDAALNESRLALNGPPVKAWRLLMAMVEHEIHHRSQLAVYLTLMGVTPPHIFGLGVEEVMVLARDE
ncbi:MAG: DinB family protein [Anaerolineae bacterium]